MRLSKVHPQELVAYPPLGIEFDVSKVLSLDISSKTMIIITSDNKAKGIGYNDYYIISKSLPEGRISEITEFDIVDESGKIWFPISSAILLNCTIYMVSEVEKGYKTRLAYFHANDHSKYQKISEYR